MGDKHRLRPPRPITWLVPAGGIAIILFGVFVNARLAVLVFAAFAIAGALARVITPETRAFVVRSRAVDVAVLGVLGVALAILALTTPLG
jgi:hypothetical protein